MNITGIVVRAYSGFYYVRQLQTGTQGDLSLGAELTCSLRGRVKKDTEVLVGDHVTLSLEPGAQGKGVIEAVLPRTTTLIRPAMANIQRLIVVMAVKEPEPQPFILDRLLVLAGAAGLEPVICFNKVDLLSGWKERKPLRELLACYRKCGYPVLETSAIEKKGTRLLRQELKGYVSAFAGPSGVGKSALLNALHPGWRLQTGKVSKGTGRGRHTTRFAQLLSLDTHTLVADTPGFTALDLPPLLPEELAPLFLELRRFFGACQFRDCLHQKEIGCRVKEAVAAGEIAQSRYHHYLLFLAELQAQAEQKWQKKNKGKNRGEE